MCAVVYGYRRPCAYYSAPHPYLIPNPPSHYYTDLPARPPSSTEYKLNKYAYALSPADPVHWASCFPPRWAEYARPYMPPAEFEVRGAWARERGTSMGCERMLNR